MSLRDLLDYALYITDVPDCSEFSIPDAPTSYVDLPVAMENTHFPSTPSLSHTPTHSRHHDHMHFPNRYHYDSGCPHVIPNRPVLYSSATVGRPSGFGGNRIAMNVSLADPDPCMFNCSDGPISDFFSPNLLPIWMPLVIRTNHLRCG